MQSSINFILMPYRSRSVLINDDHLSRLREELHRHPSLSEQEEPVAAMIERQFIPLKPNKIYHRLGGHGIAFEFTGTKAGKTLMFRADTDALPIQENNTLPWASVNPGISHKCGHDGHMAILTGLGEMISNDRPAAGRVILLFQPAEETGTGAARVISDSQFTDMKPDQIYGLHNLPGFPFNTILIRKGTFAAASKGMIIRLHGKTAHAGQPETGISPSNAVSELINFINNDIRKDIFNDFILATIVHIRLGEMTFGTAPGDADFMLTLRALGDEDMELLVRMIEEKIRLIAGNNNLQFSCSFTEEFPATVNHDNSVDILEAVAGEQGLMIRDLKESFRWSEDFGHFLELFPGAFFGLGAGEETAQLHNPDYDFPNKIIDTGVLMFYGIYKKIMQS